VEIRERMFRISVSMSGLKYVGGEVVDNLHERCSPKSELSASSTSFQGNEGRIRKERPGRRPWRPGPEGRTTRI